VAEVAHSKIPVYHGSPQEIAGIVTLKDVVREAARGPAPPLAAVMRPAPFVPETARISMVLREFQRTRQGLAIVVDEYGGVVGLVTLEDVVERIVGDIGDEGEVAPPLVTAMSHGGFLVDGTARVAAVERALGVELPESRDYATIAGFILTTLGSVPAPGTSVVAAGHRWTVVEMDGPRIRRIAVEAAT
jgi:CBS domain containing-hemolysin-like protein